MNQEEPHPTILDELAAAVAAADWTDLLPSQRAGERPLEAPRLLDALHLGRSGSLALWLGVITDETGSIYGVPLVGTREVRRAKPEDGAAEKLVSRLGQPDTAGAFKTTSWYSQAVRGERAMDLEQTNESVIVGEAAVVKWVYRTETGPHPAPAILKHLVEADFRGTPKPWGIVEWQADAEAEPRLIASVDAYLPGSEDGWTWAVDTIADACRGSAEPPGIIEMGNRLGDLLAEFHVALAGSARAATPEDIRHLRERAQAELNSALALTEAGGQVLLRSHLPVLQELLHMPIVPDDLPMILIHGDLHVGQILRTGNDYSIVDFEGNPIVEAENRARPQPAAADVAGLRQSIDHAGVVAQRRHGLEAEPAAAAARQFGDSFLHTYEETVRERGHAQLVSPKLLIPFRCRQVLREFLYAASHLPRWTYVPRGALPLLIKETHEP